MKFSLRRIAPLIVLTATVCLSAACDTRKYKLPIQELTITRQDGQSFSVEAELAIKNEERAYGYMNRKTIPDGTGMLFVFETDQILNFYMKDTPHPLSIAYIDSRGVIADILDMTPYSLTNIKSSRSVRFALEVPQGWFKANGISVGDHISLADGTSLMTLIH